MDLASLTAGLLHDTVEDTRLTLEDVDALFGGTVRQIVEGETKVSKLPKVVRAQLGADEESTRDSSPPNSVHDMSRHDKQAENLRSMFISMADDWRIVVVKLADRLHNMRTLQYMPPHKRVAIARETLEVFAPLAHRLGMWQFKTELADLSFAYLFPDDYERLKQYIESKAMGYRAATALAERRIRTLLEDDPWLRGKVARVTIEGRTKSIHSTWRKMQRRECAVERVHDLLALRIILDTAAQAPAAQPPGTAAQAPGTAAQPTEATAQPTGTTEQPTGATVQAPGATGDPASGGAPCVPGTGSHGGYEAAVPSGVADEDAAALCYHVLGRIHSCWTPMPRTIKDYISSPKPNGYRSLHTTVLMGTGAGAHEEGAQPLEIRTTSMHAIAEHGAAAHWSYSGDGASLPWRTAIRSWEARHQCAHEFMQLVRKELLSTRVFIFTQGGRILDLALGATLADAAAVLGIDVSRTPRYGHVNGDEPTTFICSHNMCEAASLDTLLSNGDIVCFDRRAAAAALSPPPPAAISGNSGTASPPPPAVHHASAQRAGGHRHGMTGVVAPTHSARPPPRRSASREYVDLVDGCLLDQMAWTTCEHCLPLPGDALVCTLTPTARGVTTGLVHRACDVGSHMSRCKMLRKQLADGAQLLGGGESMCELVEGAFETGHSLTTSLVLFLRHERGALLAATSAVTDLSLAILDVTSRINPANATHPQSAAFQFRVQVSSLEQLASLTTALNQLPQVLHVQRNTLEMMFEESADAFWRRAYDGVG